jgi:hypothetical protein
LKDSTVRCTFSAKIAVKIRVPHGIFFSAGVKKKNMASIDFRDFKIDIEVRNIDGVFQQVLGMPFPTGFWVLLTIQNATGDKETFPRVDENYRVRTYDTYEQAIDDIATFLKQHFN